jgi:hypothetical protein
MIELLCPHCGFRKSIFISELVDMDTCPLCDNILEQVKVEDLSYLDKNIKDLMKEKIQRIGKLELENNETIKEIDRIDDKLFGIMSNLYFDEIKEYGHQRIWDNLNFLPLEKRLWHIELYFQALYQIELEQKLKDNGMTPYNEE